MDGDFLILAVAHKNCHGTNNGMDGTSTAVAVFALSTFIKVLLVPS